MIFIALIKASCILYKGGSIHKEDRPISIQFWYNSAKDAMASEQMQGHVFEPGEDIVLAVVVATQTQITHFRGWP